MIAGVKVIETDVKAKKYPFHYDSYLQQGYGTIKLNGKYADKQSPNDEYVFEAAEHDIQIDRSFSEAYALYGEGIHTKYYFEAEIWQGDEYDKEKNPNT
jgi:hypothetical protein